MTQEEFWDAFRLKEIVVRTDTEEQVRLFHNAASAHGVSTCTTEYNPAAYPWSVCFGQRVTGWTGYHNNDYEQSERISFEDWTAIENNNGGPDIPCVSLEDVL